MLLIYGLIIGVFLGAANSIPDFMLFIFAGLIAWNLFLAIVMGSINSVITSGPLLSKTRFPRILLPIGASVVALVDTFIQVAVLTIGYAIAGAWPSFGGVVYLVPSLIGVLLFGLAIGLLLAALNVYVRDVAYLTEIVLQVGFWLCPIVYSYGFVVNAATSYGLPTDWITRLYLLNPMANAVLGFQRALWPPASTTDGAAISFPGELLPRLWILVGVSALVFILGVMIFNRLSRNFAQEL